MTDNKPLKIGNITLDVPFFQASLSGYSDRAMRFLARQFGVPLTFSGVMLAKSAANPKVLKKTAFRPGHDEHPIGAQIMGTDPHEMAAAAMALHQAGYDLIDLNFACPAPKVLRRGRGGYMLRQPAAVVEIYRAVRDAVACPVTMKLRIGYSSGQASRENFWRVCEQVCTDGIDALVVHGRTTLQKYRSKADWDTVAEVKRRFARTTVIGSGDLLTADAVAQRCSDGTVDGVVIARGAIGNPWIFRDAKAILEGKDKPAPPTLAEQAEIIARHFELVADIFGPRKAVGYFRKFTVNYCKLHPDSRKVKHDFVMAGTAEHVHDVLRRWYRTS